MNEEFLLHLSGLLKRMSYARAIRILEALTDKASIIEHDTEQIEATFEYAIRFATMISLLDKAELYSHGRYVEQLQQYGITCIYYIVELNPIDEEMEKFLSGNTELGCREEMLDKTAETLKSKFEDYRFDEAISHFADSRITWDILNEEERVIYRSGKKCKLICLGTEGYPQV